MPGMDRSGPMGAGPLTGGRRGLCSRAGAEGNVVESGGFGRGLALRRGLQGGFRRPAGRGRGYGRRFCGEPPQAGFSGPSENAADELKMLKAEAGAMENALKNITSRIAALTEKNLSKPDSECL